MIGTINDPIQYNEKLKKQIVELLSQYTTNMEGYSYFQAAPGIPEDAYEEIASRIVEEFM